MSTLVQVFRHNGWYYVQPLGKPGVRITACFPFTARQYEDETVFLDEITGQNKYPLRAIELKNLCHRIHGNDNALLINKYTGETYHDKILGGSDSLLFGNALTIRIKPGHFEEYPMILAVLYGKKGDSYGKDEMLIIAVQNYQLVTYYYKENGDYDSLKKTETGFYINKNDKWTSIGLNFRSKTGYGLAGAYSMRTSKANLNITPLQEFSHLWLFGMMTESDVYCNEDEYELLVFQGGIAKATVYSACFDYDGFAAIFDEDEYDDSKDQGEILIDAPSGGLIAKIYTSVTSTGGSLPGGGNDNGGGSTGGGNTGGGGTGNGNGVDIGGSGTQNPIG